LVLSDAQIDALRNLARKKAGDVVGWIAIAEARALTELGFATRNRSGWEITDAGVAALAHRGSGANAPSTVVPFGGPQAGDDPLTRPRPTVL
jgi:hypothetical protein